VRKAQPKTKLHIIKLHINVGENDLKRQLEHARMFLIGRDQVRVMVQLRGREKSRPQVAVDFLNHALEQLADVGVAQSTASAGNLAVILNPLKKHN